MRVGVIGTGAWATMAHIPGFQACAGVDVVAVASRNLHRAHDVASTFGIRHAFASAQDLIESGEVDLVSIVTPDDCHPPEARAAIGAGLHVLCEKPLARTYDDARSLADLAARSPVLTKVGFTMRYAPAMIQMRRLMTSGAIGQPYLMELFVQNGQFLSPAKPRHWKMTRAHAGAGAVVEYGIHGIDLALWLFGDVRRVMAAGKTFVGERPDPRGEGFLPVDVEDSCAWLMEFANGALGVAHAGWSIAGRPPGFEVRIYGSEGAVECRLADDLPGSESLRRASPGEQRFEPAAIDLDAQTVLAADTPWWLRFQHNLIRHFLAEIERGVAHSPTFEDGARAQEVLEGIVLSMNEDRWVSLPLEGGHVRQ
jgi:predicted dehydrogenase